MGYDPLQFWHSVDYEIYLCEGCFIQVSEVYVDLPLFSLFWGDDYISQPIRILRLPDDVEIDEL